MGKRYIIYADSGRLFRMDDGSGEWMVYDDGHFEPYELPMEMIYGRTRITSPKTGATLVATFPGENKLAQGKILEVYRS